MAEKVVGSRRGGGLGETGVRKGKRSIECEWGNKEKAV